MARSRNITNGIFAWCSSGDHTHCRREYENYYFDGKKMVKTGEVVRCQCTKRGCGCSKNKKTKIEDVVEAL